MKELPMSPFCPLLVLVKISEVPKSLKTGSPNHFKWYFLDKKGTLNPERPCLHGEIYGIAMDM